MRGERVRDDKDRSIGREMRDWPDALKRNAAVIELAAAILSGALASLTVAIPICRPSLRMSVRNTSPELMKCSRRSCRASPRTSHRLRRFGLRRVTTSARPLRTTWTSTMKAEKVDTPVSDELRERIKGVLDYPIGADMFTFVGKRYPIEVHTVKHGTFPFPVIFDTAIIREARACERDGARVMLSWEASQDARTVTLVKIERV